MAVASERTRFNVNNSSPFYSKQLRKFGGGAMISLLAAIVLVVYLSPFGYMTITSLKNREQMVATDVLPKSSITFDYEGESFPDYNVKQGDKLPVYLVETDAGEKTYALVKSDDEKTLFIDTKNPNAGIIEMPVMEGLTPATETKIFKYFGADYPEYEIKRNSQYPVYLVPTESGTVELALAKQGETESVFVDPAAPDAAPMIWQGDVTQLEAVQLPVEYTHRAKALPEVSLISGESYQLYTMPDGQEWAVVKEGRPPRTDTYWVDPQDLDKGIFVWNDTWVGNLKPVKELDVQWDNYPFAYREIKFPRLLFNTTFIAIVGLIGTVISSVCVAYAFARFPIPGKGILFIILISTIVLPRQVTLVPTYAVFSDKYLGWTGTWLPLIVPHFFANAYNVFLLRQFFRTLPRELDEAAMIDGAGPLRVLWSVIIPQSYPAIVAVSLFHFVFAWNDYFEPLIYLLGKRELQPITVGIQQFNYVYDQQPQYIQATSLMALIVPVLLFFFAQKVFMRGVVITGVDK
ncbi:MAG: carbohydrate ABC transporter permease [Anaerolineae bacterium]|nr:carbohydrate ABC transporter permease [Anaerolineae bacterium]